MKTIDPPLWYKLIYYQKENKIIENGLTIPYLIGSYKICNEPINGIDFLIFEVTEANLEKCALLQMCPNIGQYVIGIDDREFCDHFLKKEIRFINSYGYSSLYITQNAKSLGNDVVRIVKHFETLYHDYIENGNYSWNNQKKSWEKFTSQEINLIKKMK